MFRRRLGLTALLGVATLLRLLPLPRVFRGRVVWSSNDAYHYATVADDLDGLGLVQAGAAGGEPGWYALAHWTQAVGGESVLALLPVAAGVCTVALVAWLVDAVAGDWRLTWLATAAAAGLPLHVQHTSVGAIDHHALDYLLLAAVAVAGVALLERRRLAGVALAAAVAAAVLAWNGAPLLIGPPLVALAGVAGWQGDRRTVEHVAVALAAATGLVAGPHLLWSWHRPVIVLAPALTGAAAAALGGVALLRGRDAWRRVDVATAAAAPVTGVGLVAVAYPHIVARTHERVADDLLGRDTATEAIGLVDPTVATTAVPLAYSGALLPWVAVGAAVAWRRGAAWRWLALLAAWPGALAAIQLRFLAPAVVGFAPVGALGAARATDWMGGPATLRAAVAIAVVALTIASGATLATGHGIDDGRAAAAAWLGDHADGETVLAPWDRHRLYNYHTTGDGRYYTLAADHYADVLDGGTVPDGVEYVVVDGRHTPAWGDGPARVWQRGDISIYEVSRDE